MRRRAASPSRCAVRRSHRAVPAAGRRAAAVGTGTVLDRDTCRIRARAACTAPRPGDRSRPPAPGRNVRRSGPTHGRRARSSWAAAAVAALLLAAACGGAQDGGPPADGPAAADTSSTADSLISAWIRAAGGPGAWEEVPSIRYTVTTVWYDSAGRVERMRPRRVEIRKTADGFDARIERPEAEGLYVQTFTGDTAWATLNGRPLPPDHPAAEEVEYVGRDVHYWIGLPWKLRDPGVNLDATRLEGGGHEVRVTFGSGVGIHPGDRYYYRFLDQDPWPEQVHYMEEGSEGRTRTLWRDFATAGPITYVGTRRYVDDRERPTKELRIDDVWIDPPLSDSLFRPPGRR